MLGYRGKRKGIRKVISVTMALAMALSCWVSVPAVTQAEERAAEVPQENLGLWLSADQGVTVNEAGNVTGWKNQADNSTFTGVNGADGITVMQSEEGSSYLNFDGSNALKGTTADYNGKQELTVMLVGQYEGEDPRPDSYADMNTALFWTESGGWGSMSLAPYKNQVMMRIGLGEANGEGTRGGDAGVSRYTRPATAEKLTVTTAVKNGSTHSLSIDGEQVLREDGKNLTTSGIGTDMYIGMGISAGRNYYFSGKIAEVLVYDRVLTEEETKQIYDYLSQKYHISQGGETQTEVNPVVSAEASPICVPAGTTADKLVLPFSIDATLEEEFSNVTQPTPSKQTKVPIVWDTSTFDETLLDEPQTIYGDLNITLGKSVKDTTTKTTLPIGNPDDVKAQIQVTVRNVQREIYVSPEASAEGDGSKDKPFNSIQSAKEAIKKNGWNKNMTGDLLVWLAGGTYRVAEPINFGTEDSGSNGYSVIYQAVPGETPNLNGGVEVDGWEKWEKNPEVYVADLNRNTKLRNLFVNGEEAKMTSTTAQSCGPYGKVTVSGDEEWALDGGTEAGGVLLNWEELGFAADSPEELTNPEDIEIRQQKTWNVVTCGIQEVKSVTPGDDGGAPPAKAVNINTDPNNEQRNRQKLDEIAQKYADRKEQGDTAFVLQQPYGVIASCLAWQCNFEPYFAYVDYWGNAVENTGFRTFVIQNSLELMKNPGEFYFDKTNKKLYYYPEAGVDIYESKIVAPLSEGLIRIEGKSTSDRVENLQFSGIKFTYDDKGLEVVEDSEGFASVQNMAAYTKYVSNGDWHYWKYNNTDIPKGTVNVENAKGIVFTGNVFTTLSSSSCISYMNDVTDSQISGNVFMNTAGNSATIGHPQHVHIDEPDPFSEANKYPAGVEGVCKNIIVTNNYIENVCTMFTQADALTAFFVENVEFSHNRITEVPYSAINFGWGWQNQDSRKNYSGTHWPDYPSTVARKNVIVYNDIDRANKVLVNDGGALYTLGQQEDSIMAYNNVHGIRSVYTDEGSAYFETFYNDIDAYNPNHAYAFIWYGNDSDNAGNAFVSWRDENNHEGTTNISSINGTNMKIPEDISADAGIMPSWKSDVEKLKRQVAGKGDKYKEIPSALKELVSADFEDMATGNVEADNPLIGLFKDGGAGIDGSDGAHVLRIQSTAGTDQHNGFYLKNVKYKNAVIELDMKLNEGCNFTHEWESVSIQGFASADGGDAQLSNKESLFAGSYLDSSDMHTYHYNTGTEGAHTNGSKVRMKIGNEIWYHVKVMILNGKYYLNIREKDQEETNEWQLYEMIPDGIGDYGTLRLGTYKKNENTNIDVSIDNIKVYAVVADKAALQAAVNAAKTDADAYTEESWAAYQSALNAAKEVLDKEEATQAEVNAAKAALREAEKALEKKGDDPQPPVPPEKLPYVDVTEDDWFYDGVYYNYFAKTMTGKDETHFAPLENLARAQFAVIIHRMQDEPKVEYEPVFPDVADQIWYTDAILWAAGTGVVTGYSDTGFFGPADNINREQMAVMMYRYAKYLKYDVSKTTDFDKFEDAADVNEFAKEAMKWAVGNGIITGKYEGTKIDPQGNALRGECALIIQRFMEKYEK